MEIGTIGAGAFAQAFAKRALKAGHKVELSNRRGPDSLREIVNQLGPGATAGAKEEAAAYEMLLLAVPWDNPSSELKDGRGFRPCPRVKRGSVAMIRKVEVERFSLTSSRSFDEVLAAIHDAIGHPDMAEFWRSTQQTRTVAEMESTIQKVLGTTGLMSFVQFDHGAILRKETGRELPRMVRLVIGNPLIMKEMAKRVPDAGSYAPVTVLLDERADGVHLSYDRMASLLTPYGNPDALQVARNLDAKVEDLLRRASA